MGVSVSPTGERKLTLENLGYAVTYGGGYMKTSSPDFATGPTGGGNGEVVLNQPGRYLIEGKTISPYGGTYPSTLTVKTNEKTETVSGGKQFDTVLWVGDLETGSSVGFSVSGTTAYTLSIFRIGR